MTANWVGLGFALFNMMGAIGITVVTARGLRQTLRPSDLRWVAILFTIAAVIACFGNTRSWWLAAISAGVMGLLFMIQYEQLKRARAEG